MSSFLDRLYDRSPVFLQTLGINLYGLKVYFREYGRQLRQVLDELERNEKLSASEISVYQDERLRKLIRHSYEHVPYYREIMQKRHLSPDDIRSVGDLPRLPILTRQDIERHWPRLVADNISKRKLIPGKTGGTTGTPLNFLWDRRLLLLKNAVDWRQKRWGGVECGEKLAVFWGRVLVPPQQLRPPFWRANRVLHQLFFSSYHLSAKNLPAYVGRLRQFSPAAIEGYPSIVYVLARYLVESDQTLPVKAVFTSSEPLYPDQRETIARAFACEVFDFYGMAERVIFATECRAHQGQHINMDFGITEILNGQNGPVRPGETGRIVATGLHNLAMPLIRYRTSDISAIRVAPCSCGRAFPLMAGVATRSEDIITTPDGRYISFASMSLPVKTSRNVEASQIIQEDRTHLLMKIVRRPGYTDRDSHLLLDDFRRRLGDEMQVRIEFVDEIPLTKSGKFRHVISRVPLDF